MTKILRGVIHGRTIEFIEDLGMAEGEEVEVQLKEIPKMARKPGEGFLRTEGALAAPVRTRPLAPRPMGSPASPPASGARSNHSSSSSRDNPPKCDFLQNHKVLTANGLGMRSKMM